MIVAKISGRLVESPQLASRLGPILEGVDGPLVLIAGGGAAADLVREWGRSLELSEYDAHWLAIRAMSLQAELLARRLHLPLSRRFDDCQVHRRSVLDLWDELIADSESVPVGWHVTSDSLSAWAARRLNAEKLVMVKPVGDASTDAEIAAEASWVDSYFPTAAQNLLIDWRRCDF
jgi:5-(aminomethyl)-3-furanmethanol phosphate kinase